VPDTEDQTFAPFWAGTRNGEIRMPKCDGCGTLVWPPRDTCPRCYGERFTWMPVDGRGELYSYTVVHYQTVHGMPPPYVVGVVTLAETDGVRLLGNIVDCDPGEVAMGMPLVARFDAISPACTLVNWRPAYLGSPASDGDQGAAEDDQDAGRDESRADTVGAPEQEHGEEHGPERLAGIER
jgi:uncharacterized OB-fold protein